MANIRRRLFPFGALLLLGLAGCDGGAEDEIPPGDPVPRQGSIRVVNAMPDAPNVSARLLGSLFASLDFGQASALTKQLVGIYNMRFVYIDPEGDATEVVPEERIELTQEDEVNFVLAGTWAQPRLLRFENVEIDFGVATRDDADVQVVHTATGTGAVDVYLTAFGADLATATPLASVSFGEVGDLEAVAVGTDRQLRLTTAGTTNVLFDSGQFTLTRFTRLLLLVSDYFGPGGSGVRLTPVAAAGATTFPAEPLEAAVRFGNFVADVPSMDVYFVDTSQPPVYPNVAFGSLTARQSFASGARNVKLTAAGTLTPFVVEGATTLVAGTYQTIFAGGLDQGDTAGLATVVDDVRSIATEARLRFDHTAPAGGIIDVYVRPPGESIDGVPPTISAFSINGRRVASLLPGSYDVTVTRTGTKVSLVGPEPIAVTLGGLYTLVLTDAPGGGSPVALRRFDDLEP